MSTVKRDDSAETGSSFQLDLGANGLIKIDVFRPVPGKEEVLVELSGQRCSDSKIDNVMVAFPLGDAVSVWNALGFAIKFVQDERRKNKGASK